MLKPNLKTLFILLVFTPIHLFSQEFKHLGKEVEHLTFYDTLFGNEHEFMVCYPKDHQGFFFAIIGLTIFTILLAIYIFYSFRKHNRQLKRINDIIHVKNTELLDSIRYAQRIQNTILPTQEEFQNTLPNGFVFYQPKDIVSGDFYWIHQQDDKTIVAVVDCTGHGVPGAFLSLIGHNSLVRAVKDDKVLEPNMILDKMNDYVKRTLRQMDINDVNDGMEASVVVFEKGKNTIQFAGARMNLIHVSGNDLNIIKGSKLTVGTVEKHITEPPNNENITIAEGDSIYLHTDGVVDQFGGLKGGKYKISRLKTLLQKVSKEKPTTQEQLIKKEFTNWMNHYEQVDDVTLIGINF